LVTQTNVAVNKKRINNDNDSGVGNAYPGSFLNPRTAHILGTTTAYILGTTETVSMKTRGSPPRTKGLAYERMPEIVNGDGAPKLRSM
jgi:hypothetical protein